MSDKVLGGESFFLPGGSIGCGQLHGFTCMPEEVRPLGVYLVGKGFSVLGARLAGHATHPDDLKYTYWTDWLDDVVDGLAVIWRICTIRVLIGQLLGEMLALTAAAQLEV